MADSHSGLPEATLRLIAEYRAEAARCRLSAMQTTAIEERIEMERQAANWLWLARLNAGLV